MTSYIAFLELQNNTLNMNEDVVISKKAWKTGGSKMFIEVGKKLRYLTYYMELSHHQGMMQV